MHVVQGGQQRARAALGIGKLGKLVGHLHEPLEGPTVDLAALGASTRQPQVQESPVGALQDRGQLGGLFGGHGAGTVERPACAIKPE